MSDTPKKKTPLKLRLDSRKLRELAEVDLKAVTGGDASNHTNTSCECSEGIGCPVN
jgi:hypothetical protein